MDSSVSTPVSTPTTRERGAASADRSPLLIAVLVLGVATMAASVLSLAVLLVRYFMDQPPWPPLYAITLTGLPVAFTLLVLYVVLSAIRRSRLT